MTDRQMDRQTDGQIDGQTLDVRSPRGEGGGGGVTQVGVGESSFFLLSQSEFKRVINI